MANLRVGSKSPVFVTHVEFSDAKCMAFCQIGDIASQADTIAERVAEVSENGSASALSQVSVGSLCLALFHEDNSWYRARIVRISGQTLTVFFIDYGNTENVSIDNVLEAPEYVMSIPALSTKCIVSDCTPIRDNGWTAEEKKKIETMLVSGEFTLEVVSIDSSDMESLVNTVKLFNLDTPNTPVFVRPASSVAQSLPLQSLKVGQTYQAYVSHVESSKLFWVQLVSTEDELNSLMADIAACFAEDLPSTGDLVNPKNDQVCAACFTEDGAFYRGIVQNLKGGRCTVLYIDYGNHESKSTSELFTLPQPLCKSPRLAVQCTYKVGGNADAMEKMLGDPALAEQVSTLTVLSASSNGYVVEIDSIEKVLNPPKKPNKFSSATNDQKNSKLSVNYASTVLMVDSTYDVCLSHVESPSNFYVQLLGKASDLDSLMETIDQVAHNAGRLANCTPGVACLAQFSDGAWYRGEVISTQGGISEVLAVDFGFKETLGQNAIRAIESRFSQLNAQCVLCSIDLSTDDSSWTPKQIDRFKALMEKSALVAHVSSKKGRGFQVDLYDTSSGVDRKLNEEFLKVQSQPVHQIKQQSSPVRQPQAIAVKKTVLPSPEATPGSKITVCITALKMPVIFAQLTHTPVEKVAKLQTDLNTFCEKNVMETLQNPSIGAVCCTKYVDGGWYRGIVTSLQGNKVEVAFADFGDGVMKSAGEVKALSDQLCELPQQCIQCMVDNLPTAPTEKLEKVLVNKRVEVLLKKKEEGPFPTFAVDITSRNILDQLQDRPASTGFKGASGQGGFRSSGSDGGQRGFQRASPPSSREGTNSGGFGGGGRPQREDRAGSLGRQLSGDGGFTRQDVGIQSTQQVMVTYVKDPSNFQVVLEQMTESLDLVMDQLHTYYSKLPDDEDCLQKPQLGMPCVAKFSEDKDWYRAVISGLRALGPAEVKFVDYGNNDYTETEGLKVIKPQFMALPAQAIQCSLADVAPTQGFWTPEQTVKFEEMVVEQSFKAKFRSQEKEHGEIVYKLDLFDKAGTNVNKTFGNLTNTTCVEASSSRSFSNSGMGADMKITVSTSGGDSGWDENGDGGSGFGKQKSFGGSGFGGSGAKTSGFGGSGSRAGGGFDSGSSSSGGFGDARKSGFGGSSRFGGGDARSGGGFGKSDGGAGFGSRQSSDSGFGSSRGFGGGGGGGSKDCFKCGESGHFSRECPNAASKGGGGGSRDCFKCGEGGHMARDCPNPPKGGAGGGRDCFKCGEAGHMARDCPNPQKAGGGGGRDCYKCGQPGHMARDCPNPESQGGQRRGGGGFGSQRDESSDNWGSGGSDSGSKSGGFGGRGGSGFGSKPESGGFGSRGGGGGGGFGGGGGGGFGQKSDVRGGGDSFGNKPSGGFGGNKSGGFGKSAGGDGFGKSGGFGKTAAPSEDDWGSETVPVATSFVQKEQSPSPAGKSRFRGVSDTSDGSASVEQFTAQNLDDGQSVNVYVVFTTSPIDFYCQVIENCPSLEELMGEMNSFYGKLSEGEMLLGNARNGQPCAAKFSDDNMWYRAEILNAGQNDVDVLFVDYGNSETISVQKLKKLKSDFMKLKRQGLKCGLDGIVAPNNTWSDKAVEDFEDLTMEKELVAKIVGRKSDLSFVMDIQNVDEKVNIGEELCEKGHCSFGTIKASPVKDEIVMCPYPVGDVEVGLEMDVYVTWIENPEQFWIQPVSQENHLMELVDSIQEMYTTGSGSNLPVKSIVTGQAVVAPFSEDEAWYRGYVETVEGSKCKVRFTDYGNTDVVEREQLRAPSEELLKEPAQATQCRLKGVRPLQTGVWTTDAKDIMDSLVKEVAVKCKVVEATKGCLVVDVTSGDCDVGKELIKAAVVRAEKEESPEVSQKSSPMKMLRYRGGVHLGVGANEAAYVTNTDSVANFWCQLVRSSAQLEEVMAQLESHCQSGTGMSNFPVGLACGAKYSADESWYRAKVTAAYPDNIEVLFVDYGNTEKVALTDLCSLTDDLVDLEPQAIQCELDSASKASNQLTDKFIEMTADQEVMLTVCDLQDDAAVVRVVLPGGRDVGELLGLSQASVDTVNATAANEGSGLAETGGRKNIEVVYPAQSVPAESAAAFVGHTENGVIYLQLACEEDSLNVITETIQALEASPSLDIRTVKAGAAVCARFSEDQSWYRAVVKSVEDESVGVQFVDYGNCDQINQSADLRCLPEDLVSQQPLAYACKLTGFTHLSDEQEEIFVAATTDMELSVTFLTNSPVFDVELLDENEMNLASLLESKAEQDGKSDPGKSVVEGISGAVEEVSEDVVLPEDSTASVESTPETKKDVGDEPVALETEMEQLSVSDSNEEILARLYDVKASNKIGSCGYKFRDLSASDIETPNTSMAITSVYTPVDFWCRIQDSTYHYHQDLLQENYKQEREQLANVKEGERCVVHLGDEYHRAAITEVGDSEVSVLLVDTGDVRREVAVGDLFTLKSYLEEYPQLAFPCALPGIVPIDDGHTWTKEAGDVFKSLLLELDKATDLPASAKANIVMEVEAVTFLELNIDRKDVAECLVEKEIAKFIDVGGSKNESRLHVVIAEDFGQFGNVQLQVNNEVYGVMVDCDNVEAIVVHTLDGADAVLKITEAIAEYMEVKVEREEELPDGFKSGPCLAKCPDDDLWYRANLTAVVQTPEEAEDYQVFLVDYGSSYALTRLELRSIPDDLLTPAGQAVICRLDEVEPVDGRWHADCLELVNEYVGDGELVLYVGGYEAGEHLVMLSKASEAATLNKRLVQMGLAVAELGSQLELSLLTDTAEISFNELSMVKEDSFGDDLDTTGCTEGDTSAITDADTTGCTEGEISAITDVDTSVLSQVDTSCLTEADTSCMTEADTSCISEADTSCMAEADTSCISEADTSCMAEAETSCISEAETSCLTDIATSPNATSLTEEKTDEEETDESDTDYQDPMAMEPGRDEDTHEILEKYRDGTAEKHLVELHVMINIPKPRDECLGYELPGENMGGRFNDTSVNVDTLSSSSESSSGSYLVKDDESLMKEKSYNLNHGKLTEESDIDESFFHHKASPTGYTTSELDTTDLRDVETTGSVDYESCLSTAEFDETNKCRDKTEETDGPHVAHKRKLSDEEDATIKKIKIIEQDEQLEKSSNIDSSKSNNVDVDPQEFSSGLETTGCESDFSFNACTSFQNCTTEDPHAVSNDQLENEVPEEKKKEFERIAQDLIDKVINGVIAQEVSKIKERTDKGVIAMEQVTNNDICSTQENAEIDNVDFCLEAKKEESVSVGQHESAAKTFEIVTLLDICSMETTKNINANCNVNNNNESTDTEGMTVCEDASNSNKVENETTCTDFGTDIDTHQVEQQPISQLALSKDKEMSGGKISELIEDKKEIETKRERESTEGNLADIVMQNAETDQSAVKHCPEIRDISISLDTGSVPIDLKDDEQHIDDTVIQNTCQSENGRNPLIPKESKDDQEGIVCTGNEEPTSFVKNEDGPEIDLNVIGHNPEPKGIENEVPETSSQGSDAPTMIPVSTEQEKQQLIRLVVDTVRSMEPEINYFEVELKERVSDISGSDVQSETTAENDEKLSEVVKEQKSEECYIEVAVSENEELLPVNAERSPSRDDMEDLNDQKSEECNAEVDTSEKEELVPVVEESTPDTACRVNIEDLNDQKSEESYAEVAASENEDSVPVVAESTSGTLSRVNMEDLKDHKSEECDTAATENEELVTVIAESTLYAPSGIDIEYMNDKKSEESYAEVPASENEESVPVVSENTSSRVDIEMEGGVNACDDPNIEMAGNIINVAEIEETNHQDVVDISNQQDYSTTNESSGVTNNISTEQEHSECTEIEHAIIEDKTGDSKSDKLCLEVSESVHKDNEGEGLTKTDKLDSIQIVTEDTDSNKGLEQSSEDLNMPDSHSEETSCQMDDEKDTHNSIEGKSDTDHTVNQEESVKHEHAVDSEGDSSDIVSNSELCSEENGNVCIELINGEIQPLLTELNRGEYVQVEKVDDDEIKTGHKVDGEQLKQDLDNRNLAEEEHEHLGDETNDSTDAFLKTDKDKGLEDKMCKEFENSADDLENKGCIEIKATESCSSETFERNADESEKEGTTIELNHAEIHCGPNNEIDSVEQSEECTEYGSNNHESSELGGDPEECTEYGSNNRESSELGGDPEGTEYGSNNRESSELGGDPEGTEYGSNNRESSELGGDPEECTEYGSNNHESSELCGDPQVMDCAGGAIEQYVENIGNIERDSGNNETKFVAAELDTMAYTNDEVKPGELHSGVEIEDAKYAHEDAGLKVPDSEHVSEHGVVGTVSDDSGDSQERVSEQKKETESGKDASSAIVADSEGKTDSAEEPDTRESSDPDEDKFEDAADSTEITGTVTTDGGSEIKVSDGQPMENKASVTDGEPVEGNNNTGDSESFYDVDEGTKE